jgi:hypothetical protein
MPDCRDLLDSLFFCISDTCIKKSDVDIYHEDTEEHDSELGEGLDKYIQ